MNKLLTLSILFFTIVSCSGGPQSDSAFKFSSQDTTFTNKVIPPVLRAAASEALTYYPELSSTPIKFVLEENIVNSFMQAQPKFSTLFKSGKKRSYLIKITREMEVDSVSIPIEKIPHDVLLGWLGHELGHIADYTKKNGLGMTWFGFTYLCFDKSKVKAERRADVEALNHGLANEIIATKNFILHNSSLSVAYRQRIKTYYMSPEQVLDLVKEMNEEIAEELAEVREDREQINAATPSATTQGAN